MKISLQNSANLHTIAQFFRGLDASCPSELQFAMHPRWVSVHPVVLAATAAAAVYVRESGGRVVGDIQPVPTLPYLIRMNLFQYLQLEPGKTIKRHEACGRFIPLTTIREAEDLKNAITDLIPLLHAPPSVSEPIMYVFSEMVRNVLEHSCSSFGAVICAQYYKTSGKIAIGIADCGVGIYNSIRKSHNVSCAKEAITLALQPGITGTTSRVGGTATNAGAGLFYTKCIASLSGNNFLLYSGDSAYRLLKPRLIGQGTLFPDPRLDRHTFYDKLPCWPGTVVGIDINIDERYEFSSLLSTIRKAFFGGVKEKRSYANKIRFS